MSSPASAALLLAAAIAPQGQVVVVDDKAGPGVDFTDLQLAVDLSSDGDTILVKEGTYGMCWIDDRALTVCAETGAHVSVGRVIVSDLTAGKLVRLQGIRSELRTPSPPCLLQDNAGWIWIEDAVFEPSSEPAYEGVSFGSSGVSATHCAGLVLVNVRTRGQTLQEGLRSPYAITPGRGMYLENSVVEVFGCTIEGGDGTTFTTSPGTTSTTSPWETLNVKGPSRLHLSASVVSGGKGGPSVEFIPGYCLYGAGGTGIRAQCQFGCPEVALQETSVSGGSGGDPLAGSPCGKGPDGQALVLDPGVVLLEPASQALAMAAPSPVRENTLLEIALHGPPQALAFLGISAAPDALFVLSLGAPLVLASPILGLPLGAIPESGELTVALPLLEMPPGFESMVVHGQSAYLDPQNAVVLGQAGMVVLLDEAL